MSSNDDRHHDEGVEHVAPLTAVQEAMWFLTQLEGEPAYMFQAWLRMRGTLVQNALVRALNEIIRRHSALRTSFFTVRGKPFQRVHARQPAAIEFRSLVGVSEEAAEEELERALREITTRPFDPSRLPLIRWILFKVAEDEHLMLHSEHHLIHDGCSFVIFAEELTQLYRAYAKGESVELPPPSMQYWEFAEIDRQTSDERIHEGLEYWREQLSDLPCALSLPLDHPRPAVQRFHGSTHDFVMDPNLARRVREVTAQSRTTLFTFMFAGFAILLQRYSGETDIVVGSGVANRSGPEAERMIGMLVNTVALRVPLDDDPTIKELIERVQDVVFNALDHEDVPFSNVVRDLKVSRTLSVNPITPILFSFHDAPMARFDDDALSIDVHEGLNTGAAKVDLDIVVVASTWRRILGPPPSEPDSIRLIWDFSTELFERQTIERMAEHYLDILSQLCELAPTRRISDITLTDATVQLALEQFSGTVVPRPPATVIDLVEAQVARTPDATALVDGTREITYAALNRRANQLARELRRQGIDVGSRVGVCLSRSPELVTALLAVLKAGAAYVPLDPSFPEQRLVWTITDARLSAIIGSGPAAAAPVTPPEDVVWVSIDDDAWTSHEADNLNEPIHERDLGHILYTSGSTGTPRGVGIEHRSLVNFIEATVNDFGVTASDRIPQLASFAFDTHAEEIFVSLTQGARLVLDIEPTEPQEFFRLVGERDITVLDLPTGFWSEAMRAFDRDGGSFPSTVRLVPIGGEAVSAAAAASWYRVTQGQVRLRNGYGPTETTGVAAATDLSADDCTSGRRPPIGRPLKNVRAYVVDSELRPLPVGVPGELLIGGVAVARGYVDRPAWTAERFLPDPFTKDSGSRLYRTGDRVRWLNDGRLEFIGRVDEQIKIRGFRIEPAEVEAALRSSGSVEDAIVVVREENESERRLIAYLVGWDGETPSASEIRDGLLGELPNYMVPSIFVPLGCRPMTPTGKLDTRALPATPARQASAEHAAPASTEEAVLVEIWRQVLKVEGIGVTDNFFELGGDSLLSMQVIAAARERGIQFSLTDIFERQTIRSLAAAAVPTVDLSAGVN